MLGTDRRNERVLPVRVLEKAVDEFNRVLESEHRIPVLLQLLKADSAILVDVRMIDFGLELDLWRGRRVLSWDGHRQEENAISVGALGWGHQSDTKLADIIILWVNRELELIILAVLEQLALDYFVHLIAVTWPSNTVKKLRVSVQIISVTWV